MSVYNNHSAYFFGGQDNLLSGQFWAMGRFNLLGGQNNLLGGQVNLLFTSLMLVEVIICNLKLFSNTHNFEPNISDKPFSSPCHGLCCTTSSCHGTL